MKKLANKISAKVAAFLGFLGLDGLAHILVAENLYLILRAFGVTSWLTVLIVCACMVVKELYDWKVKDTYVSFRDLFNGMAGLSLGLIIESIYIIC